VAPPYTPTGQTRERVYRFVRRRLELGQPPTLREVQAEFGFGAVETARKHLEKLVEEGRLDKRGRHARGYRLPASEMSPVTRIPLLGRVPAGGLAEAVEDSEGSVPIEVGGGAGSAADLEYFALRVEGESMRDAGILPGDLVIVQVQETARSGDIVVAMVDDEATVKTLRRVGRRVELHPENPAYRPIVPPPDRLRILGKVVEVRRYLTHRRRP
jgi:repressor LexA